MQEVLTKQIKSASFIQVEHKLKKPYVLSFDTLYNLVSLQVSIKLNDDTERISETVPLPGYSDETIDSVKHFFDCEIDKLTGLSLEEARMSIEKSIPVCPFACSPLLTAIDLFNFSGLVPDLHSIDFVIPGSSEDLSELKKIIENLEEKGGGTVKIKLSGNTSKDITCAEYMSSLSLKNVFIRFDANKAFNLNGAFLFYDKLKTVNYLAKVHYVEQPLSVNDWSGHQQLIDLYPTVKTMLDESIVTESDLQKAIDIKTPYVKFKLFKQGGIKELIHLSSAAHKNGIKVVIGNGVATNLSNDIENQIFLEYSHLFFGASEANGFLKISP